MGTDRPGVRLVLLTSCDSARSLACCHLPNEPAPAMRCAEQLVAVKHAEQCEVPPTQDLPAARGQQSLPGPWGVGRLAAIPRLSEREAQCAQPAWACSEV